MAQRLPTIAMIAAAALLLVACTGTAPPPPATTVPRTAAPGSAETPQSVASATSAVTPRAAPSGIVASVAPIAGVRGIAGALTIVPRPAMATPTTPFAMEEYRRLVAAVTTISTGEADAQLDYGTQAQIRIALRFDLGRGGGMARAQSTVTYRSPVAIRSIEVITIGGRTWQRTPGAGWVVTDRTDSARDQVRALLPPPTPTVDVAVESRGGTATLRWYDVTRDSDVQVDSDAATGTPRQLRQRSRADGSVLTVTYRGLNAPMTIEAPSGASPPGGGPG